MRSWRDDTGHFTARWAMSSRAQRREARSAHELRDETGIPIFYASGKNYNRRACACVTFPDQRWLRFWVRGTESGNAIMTAVDQAGNRVARYRKSTGGLPWERAEAEITVHPDRELADELVLAIVISAEWLESYFSSRVRGVCRGSEGMTRWRDRCRPPTQIAIKLGSRCPASSSSQAKIAVPLACH